MYPFKERIDDLNGVISKARNEIAELEKLLTSIIESNYKLNQKINSLQKLIEDTQDLIYWNKHWYRYFKLLELSKSPRITYRTALI